MFLNSSHFYYLKSELPQCKDPGPGSREGCSSREDLLLQRKIKRFLKPALLGSCQPHLAASYTESKISFLKQQQPDNKLCSQPLAEVRAQCVVDGADCNDQSVRRHVADIYSCQIDKNSKDTMS